MTPTRPLPAVGLFADPGNPRTFPCAAKLQRLTAQDDSLSAPRDRRRMAEAMVALCCDAIEAVTFASMAWLASLVILSFVDCAFAYDGNGPGSTFPRPMSTHEVAK